jgi:dipeptidyl aminopeptidase/acylaminoacyl peptidase
MPERKTPIAVVLLLALLFGATVAPAATDAEAQDVANYPTVTRKPVTLWSDGTRLAGDVFLPKGLAPDQKIPGIVLCHGWGGMKSHLNQRIAPQFSAAGFAVLTFDYRGWGESDGRLVVKGEMPKADADGMVTVQAQLVREVVDPFDQEVDIDAAISFFTGEPHVDASRIGIWGSSLGGSHVMWRAGNDSRVKAVVSQVGGFFRTEQMLDPAAQAANDKIKAQRARGEIEPVPQGGLEQFKELKGSPVPERLNWFRPGDFIDDIDVPILIIQAEKEHYFKVADHGDWAYEKLKARNVPVEYHVMKGVDHYGIYRPPALDEAMKLEVAFFEKHLKAGAPK